MLCKSPPVTGPSPPLHGRGHADQANAALAQRFRRHAELLERSGRSPLSVAIMRAAAQDIDAGGHVAQLFQGIPTPPGSVPTLRLLAALHHLVLSGRAPELARFYPSAGGRRPPAGVWPSALDALAGHAAWVHDRLRRPVQTNEPGRAAALFAGLLWLADRYERPIRLLEIGASAGLNLLADRFCYSVGALTLGIPGSPVRFREPWAPPPQIDLARAARQLHIAQRAGCDRAPLDPADHEDRLTALSYIWSDEPERFERTLAALALAAEDPPAVMERGAEEWLPEALADDGDECLTVVWQSVVRQYVDAAAWEKIEAAFRGALQARGERPLVWLCLEPSGENRNVGFELSIVDGADGRPRRIAVCGYHGPPVVWDAP